MDLASYITPLSNRSNILTSPVKRFTFAICPTGKYCREDRCQSFFSFELIPSLRAPLEECEAAGAIKAAGGCATIIDGPAEELSEIMFLERITASAPEALIVVVTFGTLSADLKWADRIKAKFPELLIGIRGAPCYTSEREIFETCSAVDFTVKGEYETVFQSICIEGVRGVAGVSYRDGDSVVYSKTGPLAKDLDSLPTPDRSSIKHSLYAVRGFKDPQATIRVQRGCPFPCSYCLVQLVSGKNARHRSPEHIASEVATLMKRGISSFYFRADTFTLDRAWVIALCKVLQAKCPGARWVTTTRVDKVDPELIALMRDAGCYGISFGVDVASHTIGKKVHKLADLERTQTALQGCDDAGILSLVYIMVGFIWETKETIIETKNFLSQIKPDLLTIHYAHPYPGTAYHEEALSSDLEIISPRAQAEPATVCRGISEVELERSARAMLLRHYLRVPVVLSLAKKILKLLLQKHRSRASSLLPQSLIV
jgi:anaerobic magnesium-protoporphyrin IX monomethyl ester cyclase